MDALQIRYSGKGDNKMATVTFKKECTIYNVNNLYQTILESVKIQAVSKIVVKDLSNIDLAGIQLILALKNSVEKYNSNLTLEFTLDSTLEQIILNCGFKELIHN